MPEPRPALSANVALVRAYFDAASAGDVGALDGIVAEDFVNHAPNGTVEHGRDALKAFLTRVFARCPGLVVHVHRLFASGDCVGASITLEWRGADGRPATLDEVQIYRAAGGRLAERWYVVDAAGRTGATVPPR